MRSYQTSNRLDLSTGHDNEIYNADNFGYDHDDSDNGNDGEEDYDGDKDDGGVSCHGLALITEDYRVNVNEVIISELLLENSQRMTQI